MKNTPLSCAFILAILLQPMPAAAKLPCKKEVGNLCYRIDNHTPTTRERIDASPRFQRALEAMAEKLKSAGPVYIVQGYRTASYQAKLVAANCGGASSCAGFASARTSRHVVAVAADPMVPGNVTKPLCYASNQARVEFLGPRSAAAVYGYDSKNKHTWGHIDESTGSNYTPHNCGRNEGLGKNTPIAKDAPEEKSSPVVKEFMKKKQTVAQAPAAPPPIVAERETTTDTEEVSQPRPTPKRQQKSNRSRRPAANDRAPGGEKRWLNNFWDEVQKNGS